jgi:hypothetical protein
MKGDLLVEKHECEKIREYHRHTDKQNFFHLKMMKILDEKEL